ncbi:MAG: nitrous oxide reductase accessory protein NosL [Azonexus sp.]|nr:nitrous oxide reductase accessory protein NosL [Azonexus sp.]
MPMRRPPRRRFLSRLALAGLALTPLAAALAGCQKDGWPEGMAAIKWDRDTCTRCKMVISDRRFAAELRGGPQDAAYKFDDIGCLLFWMREQALPWLTDPATRLWVADMSSKGDAVRWLDPRQAHYVSRHSPMGYNYAATPQPQPGSLDFASMREHLLARGK